MFHFVRLPNGLFYERPVYLCAVRDQSGNLALLVNLRPDGNQPTSPYHRALNLHAMGLVESALDHVLRLNRSQIGACQELE